MANTPDTPAVPETGDRLAKVIARSGLCSRRDAETWITAGRVLVNGKKILTPAFNVTSRDKIIVDGAPLAARQGTRVWLYHKPAGLVVTEKDPEGRPTIFEELETLGLPRVVSVGRLDINTEGLILVTNDGGLKRVLELPATGWLRRYRVRAHGSVTQAALDRLKDGIEIDGIKYGAIEATLEREQGANVWLVMALREGKNREVKNVLGALGLEVNRLIRVSYGPFQLGDIPVGAIETVKAKTLRDQLGKKLAEAADVDFDSEMPELNQLIGKPTRDRATGRGTNTVEIARQRFRFTDHAEKSDAEFRAERPRVDRPGRFNERRPTAAPRFEREDEDMAPPRRIHFDDGREPLEFAGKPSRKPASRDRDDQPARSFGKRPDRPARADGPARPRRDDADRPKRAFGDGPRSPRPEGDARPTRGFGDKPRGPRRDDAGKPRGDFAGKPKREFGDRPPRRDDADRPKRPYGDRPRSPRPEGEGRPARDFSDKPRGPRREAAGTDRPRREYTPRPRPNGDRPDRPGKPRSARPEGSESRAPAKPRTRPDGKPYPKRDGAAPLRGPRSGGPGKPGGSGKPGGRPASGSRRPKG